MKQIPDNLRRALLLAVMNGESRLGHHIFQWNKMARCNEICTWLVKAKLTGKELYEWLSVNFGMKAIAPAKWILKEIDDNLDVQPVIIGQDYRMN